MNLYYIGPWTVQVKKTEKQLEVADWLSILDDLKLSLPRMSSSTLASACMSVSGSGRFENSVRIEE